MNICTEHEHSLLDVENYLENISFQSSMLITLINDLLDLAKLETMNFTFNDEFFDLNELINQAHNTIKYQAAQKNIDVSTEYEMRITD